MPPSPLAGPDSTAVQTVHDFIEPAEGLAELPTPMSPIPPIVASVPAPRGPSPPAAPAPVVGDEDSDEDVLTPAQQLLLERTLARQMAAAAAIAQQRQEVEPEASPGGEVIPTPVAAAPPTADSPAEDPAPPSASGR